MRIYFLTIPGVLFALAALQHYLMISNQEAYRNSPLILIELVLIFVIIAIVVILATFTLARRLQGRKTATLHTVLTLGMTIALLLFGVWIDQSTLLYAT